MAQDLTQPEQFKDRVATGDPISKAEVSDITKAEQDTTGVVVKGGPAATANSLHEKQQNLQNKVDEVAQKPGNHVVTKEEAKAVQSAESRALGGLRPIAGSISAQLQSLADRHEPVANINVKTRGDELKEQAAAAGSATSKATKGGRIPKRIVAAELKNAADQVKNAEEA